MTAPPRRRSAGAAALALAVGTALAGPLAEATEDPGKPDAPRMEFVPPPPGTYQLQKIQRITDAVLLDGAGRPRSLSSLTRGKITLLTFFYTYCVDPLGCPFARVTLAKLRDRVLADPELAGRVRFISISLDPSHDTPAVIAAYGREFDVGSAFDWYFLTARRVPELLPVLNDFGQDVSIEVDERGRATRTLHHMLKIFLIDSGGAVREIYTLAYVQPQVMFNDIKTLSLQAPPRPSH